VFAGVGLGSGALHAAVSTGPRIVVVGYAGTPRCPGAGDLGESSGSLIASDDLVLSRDMVLGDSYAVTNLRRTRPCGVSVGSVGRVQRGRTHIEDR
jgi:hypothetical protein